MNWIVTTAAIALLGQPLAAHPGAEHPPADKAGAASTGMANPDEAAVRSVLSQYKAAIERLDATGTERLFTNDAQVFENGGVEGTYANYLAKHLGPELGHFKSFKFSDYKALVRFEGPVALTTETYNYRIETEKGEIIERRGVATSVLKKVGRDWKLISTHGSSRKPKVN